MTKELTFVSTALPVLASTPRMRLNGGKADANQHVFYVLSCRCLTPLAGLLRIFHASEGDPPALRSRIVFPRYMSAEFPNRQMGVSAATKKFD